MDAVHSAWLSHTMRHQPKLNLLCAFSQKHKHKACSTRVSGSKCRTCSVMQVLTLTRGLGRIRLTCAQQTKSMYLATVGGCCGIYVSGMRTHCSPGGRHLLHCAGETDEWSSRHEEEALHALLKNSNRSEFPNWFFNDGFYSRADLSFCRDIVPMLQDIFSSGLKWRISPFNQTAAFF